MSDGETERQTSLASGPDVQLELINEEAEAGVIECGGSRLGGWMEDGARHHHDHGKG